jgi:hypothetical protein
VRLSDDSREDREQVQAIVRPGLLWSPPAMWQDLDFAAGAVRMGQLFVAQHDVEAQQVFPPAYAPSESTPCVHPSTNASNKIQALCPCSMD